MASPGIVYTLTSEATKSIFVGATFESEQDEFRNLKAQFRDWVAGGSVDYSPAFEVIRLPDCRIAVVEACYPGTKELITDKVRLQRCIGYRADDIERIRAREAAEKQPLVGKLVR
jgi:hypothetical protein